MGLHSSEAKVWLKIKEGKFYKASDKDSTTPFNSLSGVISNMRFKMETWEGKESEKLAVTVVSGGETFEFTVHVDSSSFSTFLNFLSNTDISKEVIIVPKIQDTDKGKRHSILVGQEVDGKAVYKAKYTKDNPGNLPQMKKVTFKGKDAWDNTEQVVFWKDYVKSLAFAEPAKPKEEAVKAAEKVAVEEPEDDLPF